MWGFIATGELLGTAFGFVVSGVLAAISWRLAFFAMAIPTSALALVLWRLLPEPARGGPSELAEGEEEIVGVDGPSEPDREDRSGSPRPREDSLAQRAIEVQRVEPVQGLVLREDAERMALWDAVRYVLRIRTNVVVIVVSALGYFFIAGIETFGEVFVRGQYSLGQTAATGAILVLGIGALTGAIFSGRIADRLLRSGHVNARVVVPSVGYIVAALAFVFPLLIHSLALSLPLFVIAAAGLAGTEPPLAAARLDIIPARLWGRAEGVRTALRTITTAAAPLVFGLVADELGARSVSVAAAQSGNSSGGIGSAQGLEYTFTIMLVVLIGAGLVLLLRATRTYPRDVATAVASDAATRAPAHREPFVKC